MATTLDRLKFIISADASSAISAFEQVAASADQNFEQATERLDRMANKMVGFGATALAGAGIVSRQFYRITTGASDLSETVNKTRVVFGDAFEQIDEYARGASRAIGTSRRQALDAASSFGLFGKSAGKTGEELATFTTDLVTLSADLASFFNTSIPDAQQALSAALRGESEPIRRYNVLLNDAALKARAMSMAIYDGKGPLTGQQKILAAYSEILAQTNDAQGDFARTSDGLANSQRTLDANIQDLKDSIGEAFLPALQGAVGTTGDAVKRLNDLNQSTGGVIGKMAAFGTGAAAVVGALSLISGLAIKMRTTLTDAEGELTNLGKTAKVVSYALATLAIAETVGMAVQQLGGFARDTEDRLNRLLIVTGNKGWSSAEVTTAFAELADQLKNADTGIMSVVKQFGKAIRIAGADTDAGRIAIEYLDEAFSNIAAQSPQLAQQIINALAAQAAQLDKTGDTYKDNMMLVARYQTQLNNLKDATEALTDAEEDSNVVSEEDLEQKRRQEEAARRLEERLKKLRQAIKDAGVDAQKDARKYLEDARQKFNDYRDSVAGAVTQLYSMSEALDTVRRASDANRTATDAVKTAEDKLTEAKKRAAEADKEVIEAREALNVANRVGGDNSAYIAAEERLTTARERAADADRDVAEARRQLAMAEKTGLGEQIYTANERLNESLRRQTAAYGDIDKAQSELASTETQTVADANERLTEALEKQTEAYETVGEATSDFEQAQKTAEEAATEIGKTFIDRLNEQADEATSFAGKVSTLISMGLTKESLQLVLSAGASAGSAIADELIAGGAGAIDTTNRLTESVNAAANRVGTEGADKWFAAGVSNAEQLVKGIDSVVKKYKIRLKSKNLTAKQLEALKKRFKVAVDFEFVSREFEVPEAAKGGIVRARAGGQLVRVAEAGQDEAIIPLPNGMKQGMGGNIEINISTGVGDPIEIGRQVVSALQAYQRRSGAIPIKVG